MSSIDEEKSALQVQQLDQWWNAVGMSPGQEGAVLKLKGQTQDFWSQQKQAHLDSQSQLGSWLKQRLV